MNGNFTASNMAIDLPKSIMITSNEQQNRGVYVLTNSSTVTLISGNGKWCIGFLFAFHNARICYQEYVYCGVLFSFGQVLIVGTDDNTVIKLTVQPSITLSDNRTILVSPGIDHFLSSTDYKLF